MVPEFCNSVTLGTKPLTHGALVDIQCLHYSKYLMMYHENISQLLYENIFHLEK
jgi:hypothetical protein